MLSVRHFCLSSVFHFPCSCWKMFHVIKYVVVHMGVSKTEGKVGDIHDMPSSTLFMRTPRNLYLHLVEEQCQFCPGDMDQAMLPVCIFPFLIIYWSWSLVAEFRWSFLQSCEWTISLPLWGMVPKKHKYIYQGSNQLLPTQKLRRWPDWRFVPHNIPQDASESGCCHQSIGGDLVGLQAPSLQ